MMTLYRGWRWNRRLLVRLSWWACEACHPLSLRGFVSHALGEMALPGLWVGNRRLRRFRGETVAS